MQQRSAAQGYYYFGLLLLGVLLSVVSRRLEPLGVVLPLAVALLYSRLTSPQPRYHVECRVTPLRAFEGDPITIHIRIKAETDLPPTELWHFLPPEAACPAGGNRVLLTLRAGDERTFQHQVVFARRGKYTLGRLYCRVHPGPDLQPLLAEYHDVQICSIYPRIEPLPRHMPPLHTYVSFGNYISRAAGEGLEFAGIRPYNSGDRLRRVHWRTSLARQELYVTDYYSERNADVVILLDTLVSVGDLHLTSLDVMTRAAASLAAHYLYQKDRVGLVNYGGVCTWLSPSLGQPQLYRILDALLETRTHFSYLTKDIDLIPPRVLPPGALIFAMTTFIDARIEAVLYDLLARAFQLVLIVISPGHVLQASRRSKHADAAAALWRLEMGLRVHTFRSLGVPVLIQESDNPLSTLHSVLSRGPLWQRTR